jgi:acyl-CoA thioesterase-1
LFHIQVFLLISILGYSNPIKAQADNLLVLGDSLSASYGMPIEKGWVGLLQKQLNNKNINIINASISGETTSGGLSRLPKLLQQHQPKWLILELGANDALRGQNLKTTKKNLQKIVSLSQQQGTSILLLGIKIPTNYGPAYKKMLQKTYQAIADKNQLLFDPFFISSIALEPDMMQQDALHPNQKAQPIILKQLSPLIKQLLNVKGFL